MIPSRRYLKRLIALLAGLSAFLAALLPPVAYFALASRYQQGMLTAAAEYEAGKASALVIAAPDVWKFQTVRLDELLEPHPGMEDIQTRRILDMDGRVIAEGGGHAQWPNISGAFLIHDAGVAVARIEKKSGTATD